jgi:hypothetical protein
LIGEREERKNRGKEKRRKEKCGIEVGKAVSHAQWLGEGVSGK